MPRKIKPGQLLVAQVNGYRLVGVVKFANEKFISIDEGGPTAILRFSPDLSTSKGPGRRRTKGTWVMGKIPVVFEVTK
jgi:hypothetical protein